MKRRLTSLTMVAAALAMGSALGACGDGGLITGDDAELRVETVEIELGDLAPNERSRTQDPVVIENTGTGPMRIDNIEWVDKPERLDAYYRGEVADEEASCQSDSDCSGDGVCLTQGNSCRDRGFPAFPIEVAANSSHTVSLILRADEENPVICPEAPADGPENYCGEMVIETNASNTIDGQENPGEMRVFIVTDGSSGLLTLPDTYVEFVLATPGVTQTLEFAVENDVAAPLTLERADFGENANWFDLSPSPSGLVIDGNSSQTFTLEMTPSESASEEDLEFDSTLSFQSSSVSFEPSMGIGVTAGPGNVPVIEVEPLQLSFSDSTTQTVTVRNVGNATLSVQPPQVRPVQIEDYYTVRDGDGQPLQGSTNIARDDEAQFQVEFTAPQDDTVSTVGELRFNHNDSYADNRTVVALLGDATEVAVGEVGPSQLNFLSNGPEQSRELMILNTGTTDLVIDDVELDVSGSTDAADYTVDGLDGLSLAPGELRSFSVTYAGGRAFAQSLSLIIQSNHDGQSNAMQVNISGSDITEATMDVAIEPSFPDRALVGQVTSFTVTDSSGEGRLNQARWVTLERPDGSQALLEGGGESVTFVPDVAGDYRVAALVRDDDGREVQQILNFEAEE